MTYQIRGLPQDRFRHLIGRPDAELAAQNARRVKASADTGFPCRISLQEARTGESLILLNFVSHDVPTPFRTAYGIFVREAPTDAASFNDAVPPLLDRRTLSLRGFDRGGMLRTGQIALPGEADQRIRALFADDEIVAIHAHNAAYGCFLACVERSGSC
jgi:uncharacterized protein DUF1203